MDELLILIGGGVVGAVAFVAGVASLAGPPPWGLDVAIAAYFGAVLVGGPLGWIATDFVARGIRRLGG